MKIAVAQINPIVGDIEGNKSLIIEQIAIAKNCEADLVVFPQMTISGAAIYDLVADDRFVENCLLAVSEIAEYARGVDVLVGTPTQNEEDFFSSMLHIQNGEIAAEFSKAMIISRDEIGALAGVESEYFPEGELMHNIITVGGKRVFVAIGDDIDFIEDLECFGKISRFEAIVNPTSDRYQHNFQFEKLEQLQRLANVLDTPIVYANMSGASCDIVYGGSSAVVSTNGGVILKAKAFEDDMIVVETEDIDSYKSIGNKKPTPKQKSNEIRSALVVAIRDFFSKRGFSKACLGLSGGVDSAVVAALAVEALGAENVEVLLMPSQFSSDHSVSDAIELANNLGVKYHIIPIEPAYNTLLSSLNPLFGDMPFSVAEENIQSRIRGILLMAHSNKFGSVVLNTTNKCEAAMGYGTLYGDTNGAISLLGDLYKGEIYDLCRTINASQEIIPQNIITKAPSAELRPDQKDSDSLPEYEVLDKLLYAIIEQSSSRAELLESGFEIEQVDKVLRLLKQNEYKRYQLAPVVRLSRVVLGKDVVIPL